MYVDRSGHFGILATLPISLVAGNIVCSSINLGKQLITNKFDVSEVNMWDVGATALSETATGLTLALGAVVGGVVKGSIAVIGQLSVFNLLGY